MAVEPEGEVTNREAEVLVALSEHLTNAEIAQRLHISVRTVESHVSSLLRKLNARDRRDLASRGPATTASELPEGVVTFVLTDVEGSTRLWERDPRAAAATMARHDAIVADVVGQGGGHLLKTRGEGDSSFSVFASPVDGVAAAVAFQQRLAADDLCGAVKVRVAVHAGEAELLGGDYRGAVINRAARLRGLAHGGQVLLSGAVQQLIGDQLPAGASTRDLGRHRLRDVEQPERVFEVVHSDLATDHPPLRSIGRSVNVPAPLTTFVGREHEKTLVLDLIAAHRVVTVTGAGGTGKTRLATEVAIAAGEEFDDGVVFVDLAPVTTGALLPDTVAAMLGVKGEPGTSLTDSIVEYLSARHLLLVLDNCEHVLDASGALASRVAAAAPDVHILATSREHLGIVGERVVGLGPLATPALDEPIDDANGPASVRLFVDRASAADRSFRLTDDNLMAVARVCARLDGIPLAIELAAARVGQLPLERIAASLDDCFSVLSDGERDRPTRHQAMRATIDWSYDLLDPLERTTFERLSVFAGPFSLAAAEAVCGNDPLGAADVVPLVARLIKKSLVLRDEDVGDDAGYRLLEPLRQYAATRLAEAGWDAELQARHAQFFTDFAEALDLGFSSCGTPATLADLRSHTNNTRAALAWAFSGDDPSRHQLGARLAAALGWSWFVSGAIDEGRSWLDRAHHATSGDASPLRARVLLARAVLLSTTAEFDLVGEAADEMTAIAPAWGDAIELGWIEPWLRAGACHGRGDLVGAEVEYARAIECLRHAQLDAWRAATMAGHARIVHDLGQPERAERLAHEALQLAVETGEDLPIGFALDVLAGLAVAAGDDTLATRRLEASLDHYRAIGYQEGVASAGQGLALAALRRRDHSDARDGLAEVLDLHRRLGHRDGVATVLAAYAELYAATGDDQRAATLLAATESYRHAIDVPPTPAQALALDHLRRQLISRAVPYDMDDATARGRRLSIEAAIALASSEQ